jgi:thioredoxin reductase (NADPH)
MWHSRLLLLLPAISQGLNLGLKNLKSPAVQKSHYDLLVIGGGSGGLAASKAAAELGKSVAVCDFVKPSPMGSSWGLGGTCVNVGCIPKKLMHQSALLGAARRDSAWYGWEMAEEEHDWEVLVGNVQKYVKSMSFTYRAQCVSNAVDYINAFATFVDPHTVEATKKDGTKLTLTADQFIVCTGGRPRYPDIPGALEHCVTSDDIFSQSSPPGKTLVVGASYVALECAGFIHGAGYETKVMMRSVPLRGFDQQMAAQVVEHMEAEGISFIRDAAPTSVEELPSGRKRVSWMTAATDGSLNKSAEIITEEFDTVLLATGRDAFTHKLGFERAGVEVNADTGKVPVVSEQTNVAHIHAIGDIVDGSALSPPSDLTELTPVAIQAGRLLASRLYGGKTAQMDYQRVPTTVFTPLEYGCVGYSEELAAATFGDDNIEVYHQYFLPLEWRLIDRRRDGPACYMKLIIHTADDERVVGFHVCSPNAGEMTQGVAIAMKCGATKHDLDQTVGIHPTSVETITTMTVTKRSGASAKTKGC